MEGSVVGIIGIVGGTMRWHK